MNLEAVFFGHVIISFSALILCCKCNMVWVICQDVGLLSSCKLALAPDGDQKRDFVIGMYVYVKYRWCAVNS